MSDYWPASTDRFDGMGGDGDDNAGYAAGWTISGLATARCHRGRLGVRLLGLLPNATTFRCALFRAVCGGAHMQDQLC